tara:strand:+ start:2694 stop:2810 length:117 start_codon:yes stop_codon:yes gene_type:complete
MKIYHKLPKIDVDGLILFYMERRKDSPIATGIKNYEHL